MSLNYANVKGLNLLVVHYTAPAEDVQAIRDLIDAARSTVS